MKPRRRARRIDTITLDQLDTGGVRVVDEHGRYVSQAVAGLAVARYA